MQRAYVRVKPSDSNPNPFQIAACIRMAVISYLKEEFSKLHSENPTMRNLRAKKFTSPQFVMSPELESQVFHANFSVGGINRSLQVILNYQEEDDEEMVSHDLSLSLGMFDDYRKILISCAQRINPAAEFFYMDYSMDKPVRIEAAMQVS